MHRLIIFIVIFALFLAFIVLNLEPEHRSNISVGFHKFEDIPVFLSVFFAFVLGMFFAIPLSLGKKRKNPAEPDPSDSGKPRKRRSPFRGKKGEAASDPSASGLIQIEDEAQNDQIKKEEGPYGID